MGMSNNLRLAIKKFARFKCPAGGHPHLSLHDTLHISRTWELGRSIPKVAEEEQVDADPFWIACNNCQMPIDYDHEALNLTEKQWEALLAHVQGGK